MKQVTFALIAFACALAPANLVRGESACPATVVVEQRASAPAPDWTVSYSGYETAVAGVTIFDGPPAQQASLVPDSEKTVGDNIIQVWRMPKSDRRYCLQCNYTNTTAQISRRLPANIRRCDFVLNHNERFIVGGTVLMTVN